MSLTPLKKVQKPRGPIRETHMIITNEDKNGYNNRIICGTPTRGLIRMEWHGAVKSMIVPTNWSWITMNAPMSSLAPIAFQVADAQNIICREVISGDFEWLLLLEDDVIPPARLLVKLNDYMREGKTPVVSGLYYTKSEPSEPLIYRGAGNGSFLDWKLGDKVWCDGVPTGCLLIHSAILRTMWEDAEEYEIGGQMTRRIFCSSTNSWFNAETGEVGTQACTSDLDWCWRVKDSDVFERSGWTAYQGLEYPFLVDTSIECYHITMEGRVFPPQRYGTKARS